MFCVGKPPGIILAALDCQFATPFWTVELALAPPPYGLPCPPINVKFIVDTGAAVCCIRSKYLKECGATRTPSKIDIRVPVGDGGRRRQWLAYLNGIGPITFIPSKMCLVGMNFLHAHHMILLGKQCGTISHLASGAPIAGSAACVSPSPLDQADEDGEDETQMNVDVM